MPWLPWNVNWGEVLFVLRTSWSDILDTDFYRIKYSEVNLALYIGIAVVGIVLLKLLLPKLIPSLFGRKKYSQKVSGHLISKQNKQGFFPRPFLFLPKLAWIIPLTAILFAVANPFILAIREESKYVDARIRVDMRDVSGSMTVRLDKPPNLMKAKVAMDAHLKFLKMREGKGDRVSFWLFSDNPYMVQDFTVDDKVYRFQVYNAPWEFGYNDPNNITWENFPGYPRDRYAQVSGEGGTQMAPALNAVVRQFDEDEVRRKKSPGYKKNIKKALLITTDADISDFDNAKLAIEELRKRSVVIYIILIKEPSFYQPPPPEEEFINAQGQGQSNITNPLLEEIIKNGGKFFLVSDENAINHAYNEINRLEKVKVEIYKKVFKSPVFYKFIFISILTLIPIIIMGSIFQIFDHP